MLDLTINFFLLLLYLYYNIFFRSNIILWKEANLMSLHGLPYPFLIVATCTMPTTRRNIPALLPTPPPCPTPQCPPWRGYTPTFEAVVILLNSTVKNFIKRSCEMRAIFHVGFPPRILALP